MLMDVNQLTWAHAKSMNPFVAKRTMAILQVGVLINSTLYNMYSLSNICDFDAQN